MFELGAIDDLVLPGPSSTTGRALASMARRRLFERLKALARSEAHASIDEVAMLRRSFEARLPGNPHAISDAISDPAIGLLLRRGLRESDGDAPYLLRGIARLLVELGDLAPTEPKRTKLLVEGPITLRSGDSLLARAAEIVVVDAEPEVMVEALAAALRIVEEQASTLRPDLDRFAPAVLVGETSPEALLAFSMGVAVVPATTEPLRLASALAASLAVGKLHALVEARAHDTVLLGRVVPLAARLASARIDGRGRAIPSELLGSLREALDPLSAAADDPLAHVLAELRTIASSGMLLP